MHKIVKMCSVLTLATVFIVPNVFSEHGEPIRPLRVGRGGSGRMHNKPSKRHVVVFDDVEKNISLEKDSRVSYWKQRAKRAEKALKKSRKRK